VLKVTANQSYATDAESWAFFAALAREADVGLQPGEPIGPVLAAAPECGVFEGPDNEPWQVRADSWEVSCEEADTVAERFLAMEGELHPELPEVIGDDATHVVGEDWACTGGFGDPYFAPYGCYPVEVPLEELADTAPAMSYREPGSAFD
jgi:hypothetical protein